MEKTFEIVAGRNLKFLKQKLSDEDELGNVGIEVYLSEDLGISKGDKVKVTISKVGE